VAGQDAETRARESFRERAQQFGLDLDEDHLEVLRQIVAENAEVMAAVERSERVPAEDPADFMRLMRGWKERHAQ
jgi:hypothetical protein